MGQVRTSRAGDVLTITLDRPEVLNALDERMHLGLAAALDEARDPAVRAVLLTGAGRGFCAGGDVAELRAAAPRLAELLRERYHPHVLALRALEKPVIAAVNGPAAGAGLSLVLACDLVVAAEDATFVPAFAGLGLAPGAGASWHLARALGTHRAFEWLASGRRLSAAEAAALGIVAEVVPAGELEERSGEVARRLAALPTRALWETKRLLDAAPGAGLADQLEREAQAQDRLAATRDFAEGVAAFLGGREPRFSGAPVRPSHPVRLVVHDDRRRWRLTVLLRLLLALPHLVVATVWLWGAAAAAVANWLVTLVRGRPLAGLHAWASRSLRYHVHVQAYALLVAEPFPGFRGWPGTYPVDLEIGPPERQSRWTTLLRPLLAIPAYVLMQLLAAVLEALAVLGFLVALAIARLPRGMHDLMAYCLRYQAQTYAYLLLLTDRYPSLESGAPRATED